MALAGLIILVSLQAFLPFDYSLHPNVLRRALRMAQLDPRLDPAPFLDASRLLFFALLGGVTLRVAQLLGVSGGLVRVSASLGLVAVLSLFLELTQILFKPQVLALQDELLALAGGGIGIVVTLWVTRPRVAKHAWAIVTVVYAMALLLATTGFLGFSGVEVMQIRLQALIPLYAEHFQATLAEVSQFTDVFLLFVPLGFMLARDFSRRWRRLPWNAVLVMWTCVILAAIRHGLVSGESGMLARLSWIAAAALGGLVGDTSWLWFEASRVDRPLGQNAVASSRRIA
jgi:hypothetical protein